MNMIQMYINVYAYIYIYKTYIYIYIYIYIYNIYIIYMCVCKYIEKIIKSLKNTLERVYLQVLLQVFLASLLDVDSFTVFTSLFSVFFVKRGLRNFIDKTALASFDTLDKSIRIRSYSDPYFPVLSVNSGKNEPE